MPSKKLTLRDQGIDSLIHDIRGQKVILDSDLARIYGVSTKAFNQAVKRNLVRFPVDFMFRLTGDEIEHVSRSQIVTASSATTRMRSQSVTASKRNVRYVPFVFTEHGALQAANILNSARRPDEYDVRGRRWIDGNARWGCGRVIGRARVNVFVIRAFVKMRETLLGTRELTKKLATLEKQLTGRLDVNEAAIVHVLRRMMDLIDPPLLPPDRPSPASASSPDQSTFGVSFVPSALGQSLNH